MAYIIADSEGRVQTIINMPELVDPNVLALATEVSDAEIVEPELASNQIARPWFVDGVFSWAIEEITVNVNVEDLGQHADAIIGGPNV